MRKVFLLPFQESVDRDMVADATLFLWNRCKSVFQKVQTGASDSGKYLQKIDQPNKVCTLVWMTDSGFSLERGDILVTGHTDWFIETRWQTGQF